MGNLLSPFRPPHIPKDKLTTIEKGEFMDFDLLKPKRSNARSQSEKRGGPERFKMEYDYETGEVGFSQIKTNWV